MTAWHIARNAYIQSYLSNVSVDPALYDETTFKPALSVYCPGKSNATILNRNWKSAPGKPYPPFQVSNTSISITLQWFGTNPNGNPVTKYILMRSTNSGAFQKIYEGNSLNYTDTSLYTSSSYIYKVQAANSAGLSEFSDNSGEYVTSFVPTAGTTSFLTTMIMTTYYQVIEESSANLLAFNLILGFLAYLLL